MKITDTAIRYTVAVIITALLIGFGYASAAGKKQDEQLLTEQAAFYQAFRHIEDEQFDEALKKLQLVDKENSSSEIVKYYLGTVYTYLEDWNKASLEYQRVLDLNPYKVKDSLFMLQFANVLINAEKSEEARTVLEHCRTLPIPEQLPEYQEQVNALLMQISTGSR